MGINCVALFVDFFLYYEAEFMKKTYENKIITRDNI
jgi:hypothetical protein